MIVENFCGRDAGIEDAGACGIDGPHDNRV